MNRKMQEGCNMLIWTARVPKKKTAAVLAVLLAGY